MHTRLIPDGVGRPSCDRLPSDPDDGRRGEGGQFSGANYEASHGMVSLLRHADSIKLNTRDAMLYVILC